MPPASEFREWLGLIAPLVNSLAILALGYWINARAASRKALMEQTDKKMEQVDKKLEAMGRLIADGNEECRGDIRAIVAQVQAFQRDVPLRRELEDGLKGIREDLRFFASRGHDDSSRRR